MGFVNDLIGGFTGSTARRALQQGYQQQRQDLQQGFDQGRDYGQNYLGQANAQMQPYIQQGQQASNLYANLNGVNGADQARQAWGGFQAPPGFQEATDYAGRQTQNSAAARGSMYSGNTLKALYDQSAGMRYGAQNDWLNRLQGMGQQGYAASGANADRTSQFGNALMAGRMNLGNQQSAAAGQNAQAMAQNANTLTQNMLGLGGLALRALAPGAGGMAGMGASGYANELPWAPQNQGLINRLAGSFR